MLSLISIVNNKYFEYNFQDTLSKKCSFILSISLQSHLFLNIWYLHVFQTIFILEIANICVIWRKHSILLVMSSYLSKIGHYSLQNKDLADGWFISGYILNYEMKLMNSFLRLRKHCKHG